MTTRDRRDYQKRWYQENKASHVANVMARQKVYRAEALQWLRTYKESRPCADCKRHYPFYVMQFDHLENKLVNVADALQRRWSLKKIQAEIAKCDLVCANCHAERTWQRRQGSVAQGVERPAETREAAGAAPA